jgi:hypothetical protein
MSRKAWLVLNGITLPLDDHDAGYAMLELDLSYPDIRDVTNNRPNQSGIDDRTRYFGGRVVTAKIAAWPGGNVALDDIVDNFAPYLNPAVRPELHYTTDSGSDIERVLILRASALAAPMTIPYRRDIQLSWVAPDGLVRDAAIKTATAMSGSSTSPGRNYNLTFPRLYPPGGGSQVNAVFQTDGDVPVSPLLRLFGPITAAVIATQATMGGTTYNGLIQFDQAFVIGSGQHVDIDCLNHTVLLNGDPTQSLQGHVLFTPTVWPLIWPAPYTNVLSLSGQSTAGVTQVEAIWQDGYIQ